MICDQKTISNFNLRQMSYGLLVRTCTILVVRDLLCEGTGQPQGRTADRKGCFSGIGAPAGLEFEFLDFLI